MKRRDKGTGNIRKRRKGGWEGRITLEPGPDGKQRRKSVYGKTKADVQQKIKALLADQDQGVDLAAPRQTVAQFMTYWLEEIVKRHRRHSTYDNYEQKCRLYIVPHIGHVYLDKLTSAHIQKMVNALSDTHLSPRTVYHALAVLRNALSAAVRQGYIARNVAQLVDTPSVPEFQGRVLTLDQVHTLLAHVETHRLAALYHIAAFRGLRQGELLNLTWADIDFEAKTLRVAQSKSKAGCRTIPLGSRLVERLRDHRRWQQEERRIKGPHWQEHGLVFPSEVGTRLNRHNLNRHLKNVLADAGLPDIGFHDLRRTCVTLLLVEGIPEVIVMRIMGHSQIATTMDIYARAQLDHMRKALDPVDASLGA